MTPEQVYALSKKEQKKAKADIDAVTETVSNIQAETIGAAAKDYLEEHPAALLDMLGFYIDADGDVCQRTQ